MTAKPKPANPPSVFRLGDQAKQLKELAEAMHNGNATATMRELIRTAHERRFKKPS